jgi:site-specific recombinase XerD
MLKDIELWEDWGTARKDKLVPYSLRGFFITMSLNRGVDVRKLAKSLGTSVRVIDQTYDDFQTERELDELLKGSGVADIRKVSYDESGFPILS